MALINIDPKSDEPIFQQIVSGIELLILKGDLNEGEFLISVRSFAMEHSINPNTVAKAFQELQRRKLVDPIRGKGLKVKKMTEGVADKRKNHIINNKINELINLSNALNISKKELVELLKNVEPKK